MELILIAERVADPLIDRMLAGLGGFLGGRVDLAGATSYEAPGPSGTEHTCVDQPARPQERTINLPYSFTRFFGRQTEIDQLCNILTTPTTQRPTNR